MIREQPLKQACFQFDGGALTENLDDQIADAGENRRVAAPLDQLEIAMTLSQVEKMIMIPALQMAFVDKRQIELALKHSEKISQIRHRQDEMGSRDF